MMEWVEVEDSLPERYCDVLIAVKNRETGVTSVMLGQRVLDGFDCVMCDYSFELYDSDFDDDVVVAWCHLPTPYNEKGC